MQKNCKSCGKGFEITDQELSLYGKVSPEFNGKKYPIPDPVDCPKCRQQRRYSFRNERTLYRRKCDSTGDNIISMYDQENPYVIYRREEWWGDKWNGLDYGRDIDFSRPFFDQFDELQRAVPKMSLCTDSRSTNSDYVSHTTFLKNCYLVYDSDYCEELLYSHSGKSSTSCMDTIWIWNSELCYECVDSRRCYQCIGCKDCENCTDGYFLRDCIGCKNCIGCIGLRNKQYHAFNEQLTKDDYEKLISELKLDTYSGLQEAKKRSYESHVKHPVKEHHNFQCENSTVDYLKNAKDSHDCYNCGDIRDCYYCWNVNNQARDCCDYDVWGENVELMYNCMTCGENAARIICCDSCWAQIHDLMYCSYCMHSSYLFGCCGLKSNQYCILNKQYTKEEYEDLAGKLIDHMIETGEWGRYFSPKISPHAYNETIALDFHPLSKEEVAERGWHWIEMKDEVPQVERIIPAKDLPESINQIPDDILNWAIKCEETQRPFRIVKQELDFYRTMNLPIPHLHPDERHKQRLALRNPRQTWGKACDKCGKQIKTTYSPDKPEIVYCEECYLAEVY